MKSPGETQVDLPIRVKAMKHRTVKVAVYPVRKAGSPVRNVDLPSKTPLTQIYAYQFNAWMTVGYINADNQPQFNYDTDGNNQLIHVDDEDGLLVGTRIFKQPVNNYDIKSS